MLLAIVGSRAYPNREAVERFVEQLPKGTTVVSGGAKGADSWGVEAARLAGLAALVIEADWDKHGRSAGPIRNLEIVQRYDEVAAFWDGSSRGTLNTVALAVRENIPVHVFGPDGEPLDVVKVMEAATEKGIIRSIERALSKVVKG